jgi:hypothetical protein
MIQISRPKSLTPCTEAKHAINQVSKPESPNTQSTDARIRPSTSLLLYSALQTPLIVYRRGLGAAHAHAQTDIRSDWLTAARPETHQNLIHNTKTNNAPHTSPGQAGPRRGTPNRQNQTSPRFRGRTRDVRTLSSP